MPYAVRKYYAKRAPLAQIYMVRRGWRVHFFERPSVDSPLISEPHHKMEERGLFHGSPAARERWIRRLPSEGGGFVLARGVKELV
jgi:hypothetical protein